MSKVPMCLCLCVVHCYASAVGLGEAEALLDNFRKLSHLPAKLKRGQKGRIKIGSLPCPEPLHTHTVFMQSGPVWRELVLLAVEMWSTSGGQLSGQSVEPTFPSVEQRTTASDGRKDLEH